MDGSGGGLAAAEMDQSTGIQWGGLGTTIGTSTDKGTGEANTSAIVAALGNGSYAAKLCDDLDLNGYDDWFLPSKDELNLMYGQKGAIEGFADDHYWSSSEYSANTAWNQYFSGGLQSASSKNYTYRVRAVRAFNY